MSYSVEITSFFKKDLKRLHKRYKSIIEDVNELVLSVKENPLQGVDLGNGLRKIRLRISSKGKGKSGGARVITFVALASLTEGKAIFLAIYDKSEKENITDSELKDLLSALF